MKSLQIAIPSLCILAVGCSGNNPAAPDAGVPSNPTSYLLTKQTWGVPSPTTGHFIQYFYNDQNLVSEIQEISWGQVYDANGAAETWVDSSFQFFEYRDGVVVRSRTASGGAYGIHEYEYVGRYVTKEILRHQGSGKLESHTRYQYNNNGCLVGIDIYSDKDKLRFQKKLGYDAHGNLQSLTTVDLANTPQKHRMETYADYDSGVNFIRTIEGLPATFGHGSPSGSILPTSLHNFGLKVYHGNVELGRQFTEERKYPRQFEYNEEGLPVKIYDGPSTITLEYRKYR